MTVIQIKIVGLGYTWRLLGGLLGLKPIQRLSETSYVLFPVFDSEGYHVNRSAFCSDGEG